MIKSYLKAHLAEEVGNSFFGEAKLKARKLKETVKICDQSRTKMHLQAEVCRWGML